MKSLFIEGPLSDMAIVLRGMNADHANRFARSPKHGEHAMIMTPGTGKPELAWTIQMPDAARKSLWIDYAALKAMPIRVELNGVELLSFAGGEPTMGSGKRNHGWAFQGVFDVRAGENDLRLLFDSEAPTIFGVALADPDGVDRMTPGNRTAATTAPPLEIEGEQLSAFLQGITAPVRSLVARGADPAAIGNLVLEAARAAWADMGAPQQRVGFHGPLNGQVVRQAIFVAMDRLLRFDVLLETGAYLGTTSEWFGTLERPVFTCENSDDYFHRAMTRLFNLPNVTLLKSDSRSFLEWFVKTRSSAFSLPFAYLDAHWYNDLPLPEEIDIISSRFEKFVLMVDDFKHPDFAYGYDKYSSGIELTLEYLKPRLKNCDTLDFLFPIHPPQIESGAVRGTLVIAPKALASHILASGVPLMRPDD